VDAIDQLFINENLMSEELTSLQRRLAQVAEGSDYNVLDRAAHTRLDIHHKNIAAIADALNAHVEAAVEEAPDRPNGEE
jgi:hypothetical protein